MEISNGLQKRVPHGKLSVTMVEWIRKPDRDLNLKHSEYLPIITIQAIPHGSNHINSNITGRSNKVRTRFHYSETCERRQSKGET